MSDMAKREFGPWPWIAGAVALAAGGALYWNRKQEESPEGGDTEAPPVPPAPPGEQYDCDPGSTFNPAMKECVGPTGTKSPPSLLPIVDKLKGPMLPPRAKIMIVGGELAAGLAPALVEALKQIETASGAPVVPSALTVWGVPGLSSYEELSSLLSVAGVPKAPECEACPPDLVIFFAGEYNMHWGPVDKKTGEAVAHLTDAFAMYADQSPRPHMPNLLWVSQPVNPDICYGTTSGPNGIFCDKDEPPNWTPLSSYVLGATTAARPGQSGYLVLKKFDRVYLKQPVPGMFGGEPMFEDNVRPNAAGYASIAKQIATVLTVWYASHPGEAVA